MTISAAALVRQLDSQPPLTPTAKVELMQQFIDQIEIELSTELLLNIENGADAGLLIAAHRNALVATREGRLLRKPKPPEQLAGHAVTPQDEFLAAAVRSESIGPKRAAEMIYGYRTATARRELRQAIERIAEQSDPVEAARFRRDLVRLLDKEDEAFKEREDALEVRLKGPPPNPPRVLDRRKKPT